MTIKLIEYIADKYYTDYCVLICVDQRAYN